MSTGVPPSDPDLSTARADPGAAPSAPTVDRTTRGDRFEHATVQFRALVEQIPATIFADEVGGPDEGVYVSPGLRRLIGYSPEEWYADPDFWRHRLHPDDEQEVWAAWRRSVAEGGVFSREYRMIARDGRTVWVNEQTTILPDETGRPRWIQGILTDVTERKQAEERFRAVFEGSPIGIALVGSDLRLIDANAALCRFLGYPREELLRLSVRDVTHPDDVDLDLELARQVFAGEIPSYALEKRYVTRDGDVVWGSLSASAAPDGTGRLAYGIGMVEDITERKRREAELAEAAAEASRTLARLTKRELELLELIDAEGFTARQAAASLHISVRTAESHLASIYAKFRVKSKDAALAEYRRLVAATSALTPSTGSADDA